MNGWALPLEERGVRKRRERFKRTKHRDQHLNKRLPTPWVSRGWNRSQSVRGCRGLRGLPSFAGNQVLCPGCRPVPHQGTLVLSYQMPLTIMGRDAGRFLKKVARECHATENGLLCGEPSVSGRPCRSAQNLSLSHARPQSSSSPCPNPSALGQTPSISREHHHVMQRF